MLYHRIEIAGDIHAPGPDSGGQQGLGRHHGDVSPVKPKTMEALIVSIADLADSELSRKTLRAAEYLLRQMGESQPKLGSSKEALDLIQAKNREGWEGVRKLNGGKS